MEPEFATLDGARETCTSLLGDWLNSLERLWLEVGIPPEQQITRVKVVYENLSELMRAMVDEETSRRDGYVENISKCRDECQRLAAELEIKFEEPEDSFSILKKEKVLRNQVKQLLKERQVRLREAITLRTTEGELCVRLGRIPEYIQSDTVLTKDQINEANTRIGFLTAEKNKREIKLAIAAKDILELWTQLNIRAQTEREEQIESGSLDSFQLSNENMAWLDQVKQSLTAHLEENQTLRKNLIAKLQSLWTRMELPLDEQKLFLEEHPGFTDPLIVKLKEEVHRLEELKLKNLEKFIRLTRVEIENYWDMMFYSEEDKKLFTPFYSENIGENLLSEHEKKLELLTQEYNNYETIYKTIKSRNAMWAKWEEMECKENDPNRFDNRGGKLLKEEKDRKKMGRDLPKMEEAIVKEIATWEQQTGRMFSVYGHTFPDFVNNQKEELQQRKDQMKENKLRAKEEAIQNELTYGSTPAKTPKRRIAGTTILTPANKRSKTGGAGTPTGTPTRAGRTPARARNFVHSSLVAKSPIRGTPSKDKNFPRVHVKVNNAKRVDTPIKKQKVVELAASPPPLPLPRTDSMDSGMASTASTLDLDAPTVGDYAEFEKEVNRPSRDLMRSSSLHEPSPEARETRRSFLQTIPESG